MTAIVPVRSREVSIFLSRVLADRKSWTLDLGCGTGLLCNAYAADGQGVTGVDPTLAMLEAASQVIFRER